MATPLSLLGLLLLYVKLDIQSLNISIGNLNTYLGISNAMIMTRRNTTERGESQFKPLKDLSLCMNDEKAKQVHKGELKSSVSL